MGAIMADNVVNARLCFCIEIVCAVPVVFVLNGPSGILPKKEMREKGEGDRRRRKGEKERSRNTIVSLKVYKFAKHKAILFPKEMLLR